MKKSKLRKELRKAHSNYEDAFDTLVMKSKALQEVIKQRDEAMQELQRHRSRNAGKADGLFLRKTYGNGIVKETPLDLAAVEILDFNGTKFTKLHDKTDKEPQGLNGSTFVDEIDGSKFKVVSSENTEGRPQPKMNVVDDIQERHDRALAAMRNSRYDCIRDLNAKSGTTNIDSLIKLVEAQRKLLQVDRETYDSLEKHCVKVQNENTELQKDLEAAIARNKVYQSGPIRIDEPIDLASTLYQIKQLLTGIALRQQAHAEYSMTPLAFEGMLMIYGDARTELPEDVIKALKDAPGYSAALRKMFHDAVVEGMQESGASIPEAKYDYGKPVTIGDGIKRTVYQREFKDDGVWYYHVLDAEGRSSYVMECDILPWCEDPTDDPELNAILVEASNEPCPPSTTSSSSNPESTDQSTTSDTTDQNAV